MSELSRREAIKLVAAGTAAAACGADRTAKESSMNREGHDDRDGSDAAQLIERVAPLGFPWPTRDPFVFCAYHNDAYPAGNADLGPAASLVGRDLGQDFVVRDGWRMYHGQTVPGFPQHPHRGFETVTIVRRGLVDHSDSVGATARYGQGDVQWLTAGGGIQHAEMFPLVRAGEGNPLELFQIWLNLPSAHKMVEPRFTMFWGHTVPTVQAQDKGGRGARVTVVAGRYGSAVPPAPPPDSWAAQRHADVAIWTIALDAGATWTLPAAAPGTQRTLYFFAGDTLHVGSRPVAVNNVIELRGAAAVELRGGAAAAQLLLLQGRPIGEPVVQYGPFVMNTREQIQQAMMDYRRTQFGGWPWHRADPVHAREEGRFARHADGRVERPA